ncbi:MAG: ribonuclease J [Pseudomonadota bacterium]
MSNKLLKIIPLGGLGEIGLNMMVFEYDDAIMVVDAGVMFPEDYMLGVDMVIPDVSYLLENKNKIKGIILTHGHEDHIGALPYVILQGINAPIYGTPFTLALLEHKLREHKLIDKAVLCPVKPRTTAEIGPFNVEFVRVNHSIVDGVGLGIRTPVGLIVHSGDFKISQTPVHGEMTDLARFASLGEEGVLALLSDSTNVEKEGYTISEKKIAGTLENIFRECSGRIIVGVFASNIVRIQQLVNIGNMFGRKVAFDGRSMFVGVAISKRLGHLSIPDDNEVKIEDVKHLDDKDVLIITTGSQGEPMSALNRMASGSHKQLSIKQGDTVILSSKFIPGNEKAIAHIINSFYKRGAEVIYEKVSEIHVSGHAFQEELKLMINLTKPRYFIPIHGEHRHLIRHIRLAQQVGILPENTFLAENGKQILFDETSGRFGDIVETGRTLVDGKGVGDIGNSVLRERRSLSEDGLVVVSMVFDEDTGVLIKGPEIASRGFVFAERRNDILEEAKCIVYEVIEEHERDSENHLESLKTKVSRALRNYFFFLLERKPVVIPVIFEI